MYIQKNSDCVKSLNKIIAQDKKIVGKEFYSIGDRKFIVTEKTKYRTNDGHRIYKIRFINSDVEFLTQKSSILSGSLLTCFKSPDCKYGYLGMEYSSVKGLICE